MECYHGNSGFAVLGGLFGVAFLALATWITGKAAPQLVTEDLLTLALGLFGIFLLLGTSLLFLIAARDLCASFLVDERGITRRLLGRVTTIVWSDLDRFEEKFLTPESDADGRYKLYAADGRRLVIPLSFVADGARLEEHLAPLRERALRELARSGRSFRPDRTTGLVVLCVLAPWSFLSGLYCCGQGRMGRLECSPILWSLFVAAGPVLAVLGAEMISRVLTVSKSGIALKSLFLDREISFKRVESVTLRLAGEVPRFERAKIRGDGLSITITSSMTGYRELLEHVRCHSGVEPVRAGDVARSGEKPPRRLLERTGEALLPIFLSVGFATMLAGGWQLFWDRTAAGDWPAIVEIRLGAALLLASIALAVASYGFRSSGKTRDPEL